MDFLLPLLAGVVIGCAIGWPIGKLIVQRWKA
jgi:uncharacterized membrane protein YccC